MSYESYITTVGDLISSMEGIDRDTPVRLEGRALYDWRGEIQGGVRVVNLFALEYPVQSMDSEAARELLEKAHLCTHQTATGMPWSEFCGRILPCKEHS